MESTKSLLRQKYLTKMLLGDAVMLFHRKMKHTRGMNISDRRGFDTSGGQYFLPDFN